MDESRGEAVGGVIVAFVQIIFSALFPIMLITLCGLSYLLTFAFHLPQFAFFASLAIVGTTYATTNGWAMLALIGFVVAAIPLTWIGFREHATQMSRVVGYWVAAGLGGAALIWLANAWSFDGSVSQQLVFAVLLLSLWVHVCETVLGTFKIIALSRPQPGPEIVQRQKAHGDARLASEAEALSFLNSKK